MVDLKIGDRLIFVRFDILVQEHQAGPNFETPACLIRTSFRVAMARDRADERAGKGRTFATLVPQMSMG